MKIARDDKEDVVVLHVGGKLMGGADADTFQENLRRILEEGRRKILVDLGDVSWVNSTGLRDPHRRLPAGGEGGR